MLAPAGTGLNGADEGVAALRCVCARVLSARVGQCTAGPGACSKLPACSVQRTDGRGVDHSGVLGGRVAGVEGCRARQQGGARRALKDRMSHRPAGRGCCPDTAAQQGARTLKRDVVVGQQRLVLVGPCNVHNAGGGTWTASSHAASRAAHSSTLRRASVAHRASTGTARQTTAGRSGGPSRPSACAARKGRGESVRGPRRPLMLDSSRAQGPLAQSAWQRWRTAGQSPTCRYPKEACRQETSNCHPSSTGLQLQEGTPEGQASCLVHTDLARGAACETPRAVACGCFAVQPATSHPPAYGTSPVWRMMSGALSVRPSSVADELAVRPKSPMTCGAAEHRGSVGAWSRAWLCGRCQAARFQPAHPDP